MPREELYHIIESYLSGELDTQARTEFEDRLSKEPELASELSLHRRLQEELGNGDKRNLRTKLDFLKEEFTLDDDEKVIPIWKRNRWKRTLSIAAGILLFGVLIWLLAIRPSEFTEIVDEEKTMQEKQIPQTPIIEEEPNPIVEEVNPAPSVPPEKSNPIIEKIPAPELASTTKVNAVFENLIEQNAAQNVFEFELDRGSLNQSLLSANEIVNLQIKGSLETSNPEEKNLFSVTVFDNQGASYEANKALISFPLRVVKEQKEEDEEDGFAFAGKDVYLFDVEESMELRSGLYYYIIRLDTNPKVLYTAKFLVDQVKE